MTPEIYKQAKNVFLIFPPGCGGNHLANLLSFHPDFEDRYVSENYQTEVIDEYKSVFEKLPIYKMRGDCAVHYSSLENLQLNQFRKNIDYILQTKKKYLFCSHAFEYFYNRDNKEFGLIKDKIYVLFSKPTSNNMVAYLRMKAGPWALGEPVVEKSVLRNPNNLYTLDGFASNKIEKEKVMCINTDTFYTVEGFDYMQEALATNFGIVLPEICRELHTLYINEKVRIYGSMMP
jgi:hypothetical protein